ncbi:MAG TPA: rhomboid family intramembrane serine protease, partial [Gemmatales bacterium]|nr:rhomboid family intramembrane serine protease [Gemmatales bacterium]
MRELASLKDTKEAEILVDYLLTQKIPAIVRVEADQAEVWVRNEDDLPAAQTIWEEFQKQPAHPKYRKASKPAQELRKLQQEVQRKYISLYKDSDDFWGRPSPGKIPITLALIVLSILASIYIEFGKNTNRFRQLAITDRVAVFLPDHLDQASKDAFENTIWEQQLKPLREGEYWRLITPIFLHLHPLHLLLNMYALYTLGGLIECRRSRNWLILFVLATGIFSNIMQFLYPDMFEFQFGNPAGKQAAVIGSNLFGGMSGVCYALFGYLMAKSL